MIAREMKEPLGAENQLFSVDAQKKMTNKSVASFCEFLAIIIVGAFGMFLSELASTTGSFIDSILGTIITYGATGWIMVKLLNEILDLIDRFKNRRR